MQAVILAGGKGTRLRPFTSTLPKPLVPVGDHPIIEVLLRQLKHHGFNEVVISTGHLAELIQAYCSDGKRWGLRITYVREEQPLGTAGSLKLIRGLRPQFLTINGDILTTLDFRKLFEFHRRSKGLATVSFCERQVTVDFGIVRLDGGDSLAEYVERPSCNYFVSMGVNVFGRAVTEHIREGECLGVPDLIARLKSAGKRVSAFRHDAEWLDIGRAEDYDTVQQIFASPERRACYLPEP